MQGMQIESIIWDGKCLSAVIAVDNRRVTCTIPHETVHAIPFYSDALGWEIDRHKADIFERVRDALVSKLKEASEARYLSLSPADCS